MAATVFGTSRFGLVDDTTGTNLHLGNLTYTYVTEQANVQNHIGTEVSTSYYNDGTDVSCDGVVEVATTGFTKVLASVITLANTTADTLDAESQNLFTTPDANAGLVMSGGTLGRTNTGFETGSIEARYRPQVATNAPTVITD